MDIALYEKNWTDHEIRCINRCRVYLRVETIADITNASGTEILSDKYFCMEQQNSNILWPYQPRPGPQSRDKWQRFIDHLCFVPTLQLKTPLGLWLRRPSYRWQAYYDNTLQTVAIYDNYKWSHYQIINKHCRHWMIPRDQLVLDNTDPQHISNCEPMDLLRKTRTYYKVSPPVPILSPPPAPGRPTTWKQYVGTLNKWEMHNIQAMSDTSSNWHYLLRHEEHWIAISDGSYFHNRGAYSWVIHDKINTLFMGKGYSSGNPITPFRAELHGIVAWYCCLVHIATYYDIHTKIQIQPYTDNVKVINYHRHIIQQTAPHSPYFDDYDYYIMLQKYHEILQQHGICITLAEKVHRIKTKDDSNIINTLHQKMDTIARNYRSTGVQTKHNPPPIPTIQIINDSGAVKSKEKVLMEHQSTTYTVENYYCRQWQYSAQKLASFDWHTYSKNYDNAASNVQTYIIKVMTGWLPVYHNLNKMLTIKKLCPLCHKDETIGHIFSCEGRTAWRDQFLQQLQQFLIKIHTNPELTEQIITHITTLINGTIEKDHFKHYTIFAGLFPLKWTTHEKDHNYKMATDPQQTQKWAKQFSAWMTKTGHEVWLRRNQQIHSNDNTESTVHSFLNQKIQQLYQLQHEIGYHDRNIFQKPIDEGLALTEKQKMTWIEQTTQTMKVSMEEYHKKQTTGQRDICQFFEKSKDSQ